MAYGARSGGRAVDRVAEAELRGRETDLTDGVVRAAGLAAGLVDNKVCAIDATWSGLRFVFRLADRPGLGEPRANRSMH
jgi:hypothetical protein